MVEGGILDEDDRLELIDGELVAMTPQDPRHAAATAKIARRLEAAAGPGYHARSHSPLVAGEHDLPEPDVALVRGAPGDYRERHPAGVDTLLVVEVARSSLPRDRAKAALYARAGVPAYWVLDLAADRLEVYSGATATGRFAVPRTLGPADRVAVPGIGPPIPVSDLLP